MACYPRAVDGIADQVLGNDIAGRWREHVLGLFVVGGALLAVDGMFVGPRQWLCHGGLATARIQAAEMITWNGVPLVTSGSRARKS